MIMTAEFWKSTGETAIKAAAAAALGVIGTGQLITAMGVDWSQVGGVALPAVIVSVLTAIVAPNPEISAPLLAGGFQAPQPIFGACQVLRQT